MALTTLKDYAENNGITYEAIRQQVARYREELGDHIVKDGRQQFLDDYAVAFLDDRRAKNPVVVYNASKDEEIERLKAENAQLLRKVAAYADWKAEKAVEIASAAQTQLLLDTTRGELDRVKEEAAAAAQRAEEAASAKDEELELVRQELEEANRKAAEAEAYAQTLKNRGLFSRLFRRGE
jgi:chromosome segregation ATPase